MQAKECLKPPGAGGGPEGFPPTGAPAGARHANTLILDLWPQNCEIVVPVALGHQVCGHLLRQPQETDEEGKMN